MFLCTNLIDLHYLSYDINSLIGVDLGPHKFLYAPIKFSFDMKSARITKIKVKEGAVTINALSTLPDTGKIEYNIPSLTKNGVPFTSVSVIPPTINGEMTEIAFHFDDYILDLTGQEGRIGGDTVNTIYFL